MAERLFSICCVETSKYANGYYGIVFGSQWQLTCCVSEGWVCVAINCISHLASVYASVAALFLVGHLWAALNNGTNFKIGVDKNKGSVMGGNAMTKLTGFAGGCAAVVYNCFGLLLNYEKLTNCYDFKNLL